MATDLRPPVAQQPLVEPDRTATRSWYAWCRDIGAAITGLATSIITNTISATTITVQSAGSFTACAHGTPTSVHLSTDFHVWGNAFAASGDISRLRLGGVQHGFANRYGVGLRIGTYRAGSTGSLGTNSVDAVSIDETTAQVTLSDDLDVLGGLDVYDQTHLRDSLQVDLGAIISGAASVGGALTVDGVTTLQNQTIVNDMLTAERIEVTEGAWDDLVVPAVAVNPTGIASAMTVITDAAKWLGCLLAVNTGTPTCVFQWQLSHMTQLGQDLYPHVHWVKDDASDNTGTVVWEANFRVCPRNGAASAWTGFSAGTLHDDPADNANYGAETGWTLANSTYNFGISDLIVMVLRRNGGTSGDAVVLSGDIHFPKVRLGSKYVNKLTSASTSASSSPSAT